MITTMPFMYPSPCFLEPTHLLHLTLTLQWKLLLCLYSSSYSYSSPFYIMYCTEFSVKEKFWGCRKFAQDFQRCGWWSFRCFEQGVGGSCY